MKQYILNVSLGTRNAVKVTHIFITFVFLVFAAIVIGKEESLSVNSSYGKNVLFACKYFQ